MSSIQTNVDVRHLIVPRSARIASLGQLNTSTHYVWIACHGYGETAPEFILSMKDVVDKNTCVVAPEGLSRFYWGGNFDGKPVASWMTREDRLMEIQDYSNYLDILINDIKSKTSEDCKIILFGFSQGCATIMRWSNSKYPKCDSIVLWSGMLPEDIEYNHDYFGSIPLYCRYGDQDRFITGERVKQHQALMDEKGLHFQMSSFEGKHKVYSVPLLQLKEGIYTLLSEANTP